MEEMQIKHEQELGSLRNDISEIKSIFKSGFSNLSAMVAPSQTLNQVPNVATLGQPTLGISTVNQLPSVLFDPNVQVVPPPNHNPNVAALTHQPVGNPNNMVPASLLPPLSRPYVIPPRRFSGCQACVVQNVRCTHCFLCGQGDHKMDICPRNPRAINAGPNGTNNGGGPLSGAGNGAGSGGVSLGNC